MFNNQFADCLEPLYDLEAALEVEPDRIKGINVPKECIVQFSFFYRNTVLYSQQIKRYFKVFGRDKVKVIIFDDFIAHTSPDIS